MVLPLIPIVAAGGGAIAGMGLSQLIGGTKKAESIETHAPLENYQPSQQYQYSPTMSYAYGYTGSTYIINSPGASSKKDTAVAASAESYPSQNQSPSWEQPEVSGMDSKTLIIIAAIAGVAIVGYGLFSGGK